MKLRANTSSFHTVFMLFLATLDVRSMEPSTSVNGCGLPLKLEQAPNAQVVTFCTAGQPQLSVGAWICTTAPGSHRAEDQKIAQRGMINDADLDFVVCALILWGLLGAFSS